MNPQKNEKDKKYKIINQKLVKLEETKTSSPEHHRNFYPHVVNKQMSLSLQMS
jgi:hypothetical protein